MGTDYLAEQFHSQELVCFRLESTTYATEIKSIKEILPIPEIRKIPRLPNFMEGVFNLRGAVIPVIDLRKIFSLVPESDEKSRLIVYHTQDSLIGFQVDQIDQVIHIKNTRILPPPPVILKGIPEGCLRGIIQEADENILVIDLNLALREQDIQQVTKATQSQATL